MQMRGFMFMDDETGHRLWLIYIDVTKRARLKRLGKVHVLMICRLKGKKQCRLFAYIIIAIILSLTIHHN